MTTVVDTSSFTPAQLAAFNNAAALAPAGSISASTSVPSTISSAALAPTTPVTVPPAPSSSIPSLADIYAQYGTSPDVTEAENERDSTLDNISADETKIGGESAAQTELEAENGLPDLNQQSQDLTDLITSKTAQAKQEQLAAENTGGLATQVDARSAEAGRQLSSQLLGLSAAQDALNGKIALANDKVTRALAAEFDPLQQDLDYQKTLLNSVDATDLSDAQKKQADALSAALQDRQDELDQQQSDRTQMYSIITDAAKNGSPIPADVIQKALSSDPGTALSLLAPYEQTTSYDTFTDNGNLYQVQKNSQGKIVGTPTLIQPSTASPAPAGSSSGNGAVVGQDGKPLNSTQAAAYGYGQRMSDADSVISQLGSQFTGLSSYITTNSLYPNALKSPDQQKLEQAENNFVNALLRRESGAAISQGEFDSAKQQYFPQPGDSTEVLTQKAQNRRTAISGVAVAANVSPSTFSSSTTGATSGTTSSGLTYTIIQ